MPDLIKKVIRLVVLLPSFFIDFSLADTDTPSRLDPVYGMSLAELGEVEITTATGNSTPLDRAPATASVITAAQIKSIGAQTLDDVLETIPGLHVSLSSLSRLDSIYSIRGIHTGLNPHVLLLINGVPVQFNMQGGRPILFRYPVSSIARIEVIRGPGSAIYGADAYSGVINVITKDASMLDSVQVGGRVGSFASRDVWAQGAVAMSEWNLVYSLSYQRSDGDKSRTIAADLQSGLDAAFGTSASLAPGYLSTGYQVLDTHLNLSNANWSVNFWGWNSRDSGLGAGAAQALDYKGGDDSDLYLMDVMYKVDDLLDGWDHAVRASYQYYDTQAQLNLLPDGTRVLIGSDGNVDFGSPVGLVDFPDGLIGNPGVTTGDARLDLISIYTGYERHRLRIALGARHSDLNSRESKNFGPGVIDGTQAIVDGSLVNLNNSPFVFVKDSSRSLRYLSVQDEWHLAPDWELTTGVRYDDYSDFGSTTNPRVALVWAAHEKLTTKLLYGSAFRAPSFSEQFNKNNPVSLGNPDLDPETIDTYELSFNFNISSRLQSSLSFFKYRAKDMIEFVADTNATTKTAQNNRDQDGDGYELELSWDASGSWRFRGNYSEQHATDRNSGSAVPDAPQQQFTLISDWTITDDWSLNALLNWVGERERESGDVRPNVGDYALLNMTLRKNNLLPQFDFAFGLRNLGKKNAREPSSGAIAEDFPLSSRSVWAELSYRFE